MTVSSSIDNFALYIKKYLPESLQHIPTPLLFFLLVVVYLLFILIPLLLFVVFVPEPEAQAKEPAKEPVNMSFMQPPADLKLDPPKDDLYTKEELAKFDGEDGKPIYVAVKGTIFDVSAKRDMYQKGKGGYNIFAGKDASVALGRSSLKDEDASSDYSILDEKEMGVLNDWYKYYEKRYNIVGKVAPNKL